MRRGLAAAGMAAALLLGSGTAAVAATEEQVDGTQEAGEGGLWGLAGLLGLAGLAGLVKRKADYADNRAAAGTVRGRDRR